MEISSCARSRSKYSSVVIFFVIINTTLSEILPSILWSTDNPLFSNLGGKERTVFFKDQLYFVCPNTVEYPVKKSAAVNKDNLYANIYRVDKQGYESCNNTGGLKILLCDKPLELKSKSVVINDIVASQDIPDFHKEKTYYFIDTSDGTENTLHNRTGGRCKTHNMKMKIYVCTGPSDTKCPNGNDVVNGGWSVWEQCMSGRQSRHCSNPSPANGGFTCQGESTQICTPEASPTTTTTNKSGIYNYTFTPKKDKRTAVADTLGILSVGEVVIIFLAIFIFGCLLGILVGVFGTHKKPKSFIVRRRTARSKTNFNRNSIASTNTLRPTSIGSILSNGTGITNFDNSTVEAENGNTETAAVYTDVM